MSVRIELFLSLWFEFPVKPSISLTSITEYTLIYKDKLLFKFARFLTITLNITD